MSLYTSLSASALLTCTCALSAGDGARIETEWSEGRDHPGRARQSEARPQRVDPTPAREVRAEWPPQSGHPRHLPPGLQCHGVGFRGCDNQGECCWPWPMVLKKPQRVIALMKFLCYGWNHSWVLCSSSAHCLITPIWFVHLLMFLFRQPCISQLKENKYLQKSHNNLEKSVFQELKLAATLL